LLKRAWYQWSINRERVRLCVGQDRSPVSSGYREEVQSPISPTQSFNYLRRQISPYTVRGALNWALLLYYASSWSGILDPGAGCMDPQFSEGVWVFLERARVMGRGW
jgi:hypothetical protein